MSRLIGQPIRVHLNKESLVDAFIWKKLNYRVEEVLNWWYEPSEWWAGKSTRFFLRVSARNTSTGIYELCRLGEAWFLHRVLD